jgi:phospholipid/cholesterol/gamma-HCH transport system ATP-binding protein
MNKVIEIEHLFKSFGDRDIFIDASIDILKGENLLVLGSSGTGKSVLIKIIAGLLTADKGKVSVLNQSLINISKKELNVLLKIGFLYQNSALNDSMTVQENLKFMLVRNNKSMTRKEIDKTLYSVLDSVDLLRAITQMPSELSAG